MRIDWELAAARYTLQVSNDGTTWTDATPERAATPNTVSVMELNTTEAVRFVRMQTIERSPAQNGQRYGVSIKELEVWDGPVEGVTFEDAVFNGTSLQWMGSLPVDHSLVITFRNTLNDDAAPGTSWTVTSQVDSPYFPSIDTAEVSGKIAGTSPSPTPSASASPTPSPSPSASESPSVTPSTSASASSSPKPSVSPSATRSATTKPSTPTPTPTPTPTAGPSDVYTTPGFHIINGRQWYTSCEKYSQTVRCRTNIWSTQVEYRAGKYVKDTGWHFNNLIYMPQMTRAQWGNNPLATTGGFVSAGRQWRTECDTPATGRGACRSYIWSKQVFATQQANAPGTTDSSRTGSSTTSCCSEPTDQHEAKGPASRRALVRFADLILRYTWLLRRAGYSGHDESVP